VCHVSLCVVCKGKLSISCCVSLIWKMYREGVFMSLVFESGQWLWTGVWETGCPRSPGSEFACLPCVPSAALRCLLCLKFPLLVCPVSLVHLPSFLACFAVKPAHLYDLPFLLCLQCLPCLPIFPACLVPPHLHITVQDILGENYQEGNLIVYVHVSLCLR
jgi:hypothetical protein